MPTLLHRNLSLGTVVYVIILCLIMGLLFVYAAFQGRSIIRGPSITLATEPPTTTASSTILIEGTAENIVSLTLNGRPIFTDDRGNFSETLVLGPGYTVMTLTAKDRYDRETDLTRTFVRE